MRNSEIDDIAFASKVDCRTSFAASDGGLRCRPELQASHASKRLRLWRKATETTDATPNPAAGRAFRQRRRNSGRMVTLFHSKPLNALIEQALANNADLGGAGGFWSHGKQRRLSTAPRAPGQPRPDHHPPKRPV
jgi:hypothetical protein